MILIRQQRVLRLSGTVAAADCCSNGQEGADHEIRFGLAGSCECVGIMPASSEECEPGVSLASLGTTYTVGSTQHRAEPDRNTALVKEGEFESPETIAAIERNREDRERTVVIDR
jgi:hypothetical protein